MLNIFVKNSAFLRYGHPPESLQEISYSEKENSISNKIVAWYAKMECLREKHEVGIQLLMPLRARRKLRQAIDTISTALHERE